MTTEKEIAETYRKAAYELLLQNFDDAAAHLRKRADALDPPKPVYPDGTVAWVTSVTGIRYLASRYDKEWHADFANGVGVSVVAFDEAVTKVEPLRVLGDDEIALPRAAFDLAYGSRDAERARAYAEKLSVDGYSVAPKVFHAYADALDAEQVQS